MQKTIWLASHAPAAEFPASCPSTVPHHPPSIMEKYRQQQETVYMCSFLLLESSSQAVLTWKAAGKCHEQAFEIFSEWRDWDQTNKSSYQKAKSQSLERAELKSRIIASSGQPCFAAHVWCTLLSKGSIQALRLSGRTSRPNRDHSDCIECFRAVADELWINFKMCLTNE